MKGSRGRILLSKRYFSIPILDSSFVLLSQGLYQGQDLCHGGKVVVHSVSGSLQGLKAI